jgi:hypothetical protein
MPKAKTKAQRLRLKRGRPRLPATDREPNGQPSRRIASTTNRSQENIMNVAIARRIREHEFETRKDGKPGKILTIQQAIDPKRGYALGLLNLDGKITTQQHDIGLKVAKDMARYYGLTGVPFPSARAQTLFSVHSDGEDSDARGQAARRARDKMVAIRACLLSVGDIDTGRRVYRTVMSVAVEDMPATAHMLDNLRRGLNKVGSVVYGM